MTRFLHHGQESEKSHGGSSRSEANEPKSSEDVMSTMFAGYVAPSQEEALMVLQVLCMTGEGLTFKIPGSTLGRDVHKIVSEQLPCKPGARLSMHLGSTKLMLHVPIEDQCTGPATLSFTYVPTNLYPGLY